MPSKKYDSKISKFIQNFDNYPHLKEMIYSFSPFEIKEFISELKDSLQERFTDPSTVEYLLGKIEPVIKEYNDEFINPYVVPELDTGEDVNKNRSIREEFARSAPKREPASPFRIASRSKTPFKEANRELPRYVSPNKRTLNPKNDDINYTSLVLKFHDNHTTSFLKKILKDLTPAEREKFKEEYSENYLKEPNKPSHRAILNEFNEMYDEVLSELPETQEKTSRKEESESSQKNTLKSSVRSIIDRLYEKPSRQEEQERTFDTPVATTNYIPSRKENISEEVNKLKSRVKGDDYLEVPKDQFEIPSVPLEEGEDYLSKAAPHALEVLREALSLPDETSSFDAHIPLPEETLEATAMLKKLGKEGLPEEQQYNKQIQEKLNAFADQANLNVLQNILKNPASKEEYDRAKQLIDNKEFLKEARDLLLDEPEFLTLAHGYIVNPKSENQAIDLMNNAPTKFEEAENVFKQLPDFNKDYDLDKNEENLFQQKWDSFVAQARRNFEQNELRRTNNRFAGKDVWKSGIADTYRKEIEQDFNRALMEKQIAIREAARAESLRRKEMHDEERARKTQTLMALAQKKADIENLRFQNRMKKAETALGINEQDFKRAAILKGLDESKNIARAAKMLELQEAQQRQGSNLGLLQNMRSQQETGRASQLTQAEALRQAQLSQLVSQLGSRQEEAKRSYNERINALSNAGNVLSADQQRHKEVLLKQMLRHQERPVAAATTYLNAARGFPVTQPTQYSADRHMATSQLAAPPSFQPLNAPPIDQTAQQLTGLASTIGGMYLKNNEQQLFERALGK